MFEGFPLLHGNHLLYREYFPLLLATTSLLTAGFVLAAHACVVVGLRRKLLGLDAPPPGDGPLLKKRSGGGEAGGGGGVELELSELAPSADAGAAAADDRVGLAPG